MSSRQCSSVSLLFATVTALACIDTAVEAETGQDSGSASPTSGSDSGVATLRELDCGNLDDDDGDGLTDCGDTDCEAASCPGAGCGTAGTCRSGSCAQTPLPVGTVCRAVSGNCDVAEVCNGSLECPPEDFLPEGQPCGGECSACDGFGGCQPLADGMHCGDGHACLNGTCTTCGGALEPCCDETVCFGGGSTCEEGICLSGPLSDAGPDPDAGSAVDAGFTADAGGRADAGPAPVVKKTIVMAADIVQGTYANRARRVAALIKAYRPEVDFIAAGGDNARYPHDSPLSLLEYFRRFWAPADQGNWGQFDPIIFPVPGNHEYNAPNAHGHFVYFRDRLNAIAARNSYHGFANVEGKGYYSYDIAGWHFVALNSNCADVGGCASTSAQYQWLKSDLQRHAQMPIIAYFHHPPFWCAGNPFARNAIVRPFWNALHDAGADFIFTGHTHFYQRFKPLSRDMTAAVTAARGVRHIIVGNSGVDSGPGCSPADSRLVKQAGGDAGVGAFFLTIGRDGSYSFKYKTLNGDVVDNGSGFSRHRP